MNTTRYSYGLIIGLVAVCAAKPPHVLFVIVDE